MAATPASAPVRRLWIVSPAWDLCFLVLTPLAIVPAVLLALEQRLSPEQIYLAVISFASLGHHLPGFMRAYGDRELFARYRWRFLLAPPLVLGVALLFTPPRAVAGALGLPWTHLHGLELILLLWGTWHGLMQTYGFMRIYDLRRGENDRRTARLDHALCVAIFVAGVVFSDTRMFGVAGAMWQCGLPLFGPETLAVVRWGVGIAGLVVLGLYVADALGRQRRGAPVNGVKLLLAAVTGWFWWYCGRLSTNLLIGVAMFEIFHAVQYNAIVWIYNRRLLTRAGERFGPLGFLFRDRVTMLGLYLGAIAAYSSIRYFTAQPDDRMFSGDLANAHQWLIALFVTSSLLHFYYDGFIWKVSERRTGDNLVDGAVAPPWREHVVPAALHAGKWATLGAIAAALVAAEWRYDGAAGAQRRRAERAALAALTPQVPEAAMLGSQEALAAGDAATAAALARQAAAARPESPQSQAELACALSEAGEYADAQPALERAIELAPQEWVYHCDLGEVREKLGELEQAEASYRRAAELAPSAGEPWQRLATMFLQQDRIGEAIAALGEWIEREPDAAQAHYRLGLVRLKQGDVGGAIVPLRQATRLDPSMFEAWLQLGDAMMALAKPQAAAGAYERAVELRPEVADARVCLADAMVQAGRFGEAEEVLRAGLRRQPNSPELCLTLGLLLQAVGEPEAGEALLRRASELGLDVVAIDAAE